MSDEENKAEEAEVAVKDAADEILDGDFFDTASDKNAEVTLEEGRAADKIMSPSADTVIAEAVIEVGDPHAKEREPEDIPSLRGEGFPSDYIGMVERIKWQYEMLPHMDYDAIYTEMAELSIKACPTPTLQVLNDEIQKVQGCSKDVRGSEG